MINEASVYESTENTTNTIKAFVDGKVMSGSAEEIVFISKSINELLNAAHTLFMSLPIATQDKITEFHNFEGSITHCINAGMTATEEIQKAAEVIANNGTDSENETGPDWYERRDELCEGQVFMTFEGHQVRLDRRVPGDGSKWYVHDWSEHSGSWSHEDSTIEPGDLCGEPLQ